MTPASTVNRYHVCITRLHCIFSAVSKKMGMVFSPTFAAYAATMPDTAVDAVAEHRVNAMITALHSLQVLPYGIAAMVGVVIDAHIPMIESGQKDVFMAYRLGLVPESLPDADFCATLVAVDQLLSKRNASSACLMRMLQKGMPFPGSMRYVQSQLIRCANTPECKPLVARILFASLTGAYPHCLHIAPLETRRALHSKTAIEILDWFCQVPRASHEYYVLVSEFVYAASQMSPLQWQWACVHPRYTDHGTAVCAAGDILRRGLRPGRFLTLTPLVNRNQFVLFASLQAQLGGRKKITTACQTILPASKIASVYKAAVNARAVLNPVGTLVAIGGMSFLDMANARTDTDVRRAYTALSPVNKSIFQVIVHGMTVRDTVAFVPLTPQIRLRQQAISIERNKSSMYMVMICRACGTWRAKSTISGLSRGTIGVRVSFPIGNGLRCNACHQTWGISSVNMVGLAIRARARIETEPVWILMCTCCGIPTDSYTYIGLYPVCAMCAKRPNPFNIHQECYACSSTSGLRSFSALKYGKPSEFFACHVHWPRFDGFETCDIVAVRERSVSRGGRRYIRHDRKSFKIK